LLLLVYGGGLGGGFTFDDGPNLLENDALRHATAWDARLLWDAAWSSQSGPLRRPLSLLSFALEHVLFGMDPWVFKATNVLIHLAAGIGLLRLGRTLYAVLPGGSALCPDAALRLAAVAAAFWLLHPLQLTSVLYVVQRMNSLAALFMIWGMACYAAARRRQLLGQPGWGGVLAAYGVFLPLAVLSKENGALLPVFLLLIEGVFFRLQGVAGFARRALLGLHLGCAVAPILLGGAYLLLRPDWILHSYANRDFTLPERLWTEARILWRYVWLSLVPDITRMGLYHDDVVLSRTPWTPWTTLPALLGWGLLIGLALRWRTRWPAFFFGVAFFLIGHALESTVFGLELMHEHRNYLALYGPIFAVCHGAHARLARLSRSARLSVVLLPLLVLAGLTGARAYVWGDDLRRSLFEARHHPDSPRANIEAAVALLRAAEASGLPAELREARLREAAAFFAQAARRDTYGVSGLLGQLVCANKLGRPVDAALLSQAEARLRQVPLASATPGALIELLRCQTAGACRFAIEVPLGLLRATLENPALRALDRARLMTEAAQLFLQRGALPEALTFAAMAVNAQPEDPQTHLNLALILIRAGYLADAQYEIEQARQRSDGGFYAARVAALQAELDAVQSALPASGR
jgi:hypothetical protein